MGLIYNPIVPVQPIFIGYRDTLNYQAICVYAAIGFFLDQDTFYNELKVVRPATLYDKNEVTGSIVEKQQYFSWHYSPRERSLRDVVEEFAVLFEKINKGQIDNKRVILPLSGGLDSRSQAVALHYLKADVSAYSYKFRGGHDETSYSKQIAEACEFPFKKLVVESGYLWPVIEKLTEINKCYAEFTHPRQMAFMNQYAAMGDVFSLGHWGDVLFDDMGVPNDLPLEKQVEVILKKILKKGGAELAKDLWQAWGLAGDFNDYLYERVNHLLGEINIPHSANARIRAFKSLYWAPRWTSTNLSIFSSVCPIFLPYYDNRMCEFICSVPERHLAGRQIQIEYIKLRAPALAKIPWQQHRPFNLYNYPLNRVPFNLPYKVYDKVKRMVNPKKFIQRNWELQFLGTENDAQLRKWLFEQASFKNIVPESIVKKYYDRFKTVDQVFYSHPVSMLLTLSLFYRQDAK